MSHQSPDSSLFSKTSVYVAFLITLALAVLYHISVGIVAIWPDTLIYADRARSLLGQGGMPLNASNLATHPPLYSLFMALCFSAGASFGPGIVLGHQILVMLQVVLISSIFFPIRALLTRSEGVSSLQATLLAVIFTLSATALPYATMLCAEALFIPLFIWFTCFYDKFLSSDDGKSAIFGAVTLGLLLLTMQLGWVVYIAVVINTLIAVSKKQSIKSYVPLLIVPIVFAALWQIYAIAVMGQAFEFPSWDLNNGLARFNFLKNSILYLMYAGMPLAGTAFLMLCFYKKHNPWQSPIFCFSFLMLLGALLYIVLTNTIVVENKLDYITNRLIEPFVILTLIAFIRMPAQLRKEITANSILIYFGLGLLGFPYVLMTDFLTGMSYWAQSLPNPNLGIVRNVVYLLLISLPVIVIWWKPKHFMTAYICVALLITLGNMMQNSAVWAVNDGNFRYVDPVAIAANKDVSGAKSIYVENNCNSKSDTDTGYLFRCNDMYRLQYYLPKVITGKTTQDLRSLNLNDDEYILFLSSENDNIIGKPVAELGLASISRIDQKDVAAYKQTPLVAITSIDELAPYVNIQVGSGMQRITTLGSNAEMRLDADMNGCAEIVMKMADGSEEANSKSKLVQFTLNGKPLKKITFLRLTNTHLPEDTAMQLPLNKGQNTLQLSYEMPAGAPKATKPTLFMFNRPQLRPCK